MQTQLKKAGESMDRRLEHMRKEFSEIRAGRANPAVLDKITVDYYGAPSPIQTIAAVTMSDARTLVISPWDPQSLKNIEKAILASDLGLPPANDGKVIRLNFPALTEDRRKEITKEVSKFGEDSKIGIRNIRRDANDKCKEMKKNGEMTEDEQKTSEKSVQDLTDKYIKEIDAITAEKQKEVMSI